MLNDEETAKSRISVSEKEIETLNKFKPTGYKIEIEYRKSLIARWNAIIDGEKKEKKKCSRCGKTKHLNDFYNRKKSKDGKQAHCKVCNTLKTSVGNRNGNELATDKMVRTRLLKRINGT